MWFFFLTTHTKHATNVSLKNEDFASQKITEHFVKQLFVFQIACFRFPIGQWSANWSEYREVTPSSNAIKRSRRILVFDVYMCYCPVWEDKYLIPHFECLKDKRIPQEIYKYWQLSCIRKLYWRNGTCVCLMHRVFYIILKQ